MTDKYPFPVSPPPLFPNENNICAPKMQNNFGAIKLGIHVSNKAIAIFDFSLLLKVNFFTYLFCFSFGIGSLLFFLITPSIVIDIAIVVVRTCY